MAGAIVAKESLNGFLRIRQIGGVQQSVEAYGCDHIASLRDTLDVLVG